jgi:hypothetical protein
LNNPVRVVVGILLATAALLITVSITASASGQLSDPNNVGHLPNAGTTDPGSGQVSLTPNSVTCTVAWHALSSPSPDPYWSILRSVSAVSSTDAWAVGETGQSSQARGLLLHWDGISWSVVTIPQPGTASTLNAVAAISASDVWAFGTVSDGASTYASSLAIHWDGVTWTVVNTPNARAYWNSIYSVTVVAPNNIWAVGFTSDASGQVGFILHWDGTTWAASTTALTDGLEGVASTGPGNIWAVGSKARGPGLGSAGIAIHWDGTSWTPYDSGLPQDAHLAGVSIAHDGSIWVTGAYQDLVTYAGRLVALHRNSQNGWDRYSFDPSTYNFSSVVAITGSDVWIVGNSAVHWNGSTWTTYWNNDPVHSLIGIFALSSQDIWAVGLTYNYSYASTLVMRFSDPCIVPTETPTASPTATSTSTPEPPRCPGERFTDVCPGDYFYGPVLALNDDGIVSGYNTAPPCNSAAWIPCFKPGNNSSRGQISKIVSLAANFNDPVSGQSFEDVPPGSTFYTFTEIMATRGIITGYACGGIGEPCVYPGNRPYFRSSSYVTRGQLSKIVSNSFGWNEPVSGQLFEDVLIGSTFYDYIGRLASRNIVTGYPCGGLGEPCGQTYLPYFRPNASVTRAQIAKIVQLARTQPNSTPTVQPTSTTTTTPMPSPTATSTALGTDTPVPTSTAMATATMGMH